MYLKKIKLSIKVFIVPMIYDVYSPYRSMLYNLILLSNHISLSRYL